MHRPGSMLLIVALLAMSLAGCVSASRSPVLDSRAGDIGRQIGRACPTPTDIERMKRIATYLETAPQGEGLDDLATEWERLDAGARACRGQG